MVECRVIVGRASVTMWGYRAGNIHRHEHPPHFYPAGVRSSAHDNHTGKSARDTKNHEHSLCLTLHPVSSPSQKHLLIVLVGIRPGKGLSQRYYNVTHEQNKQKLLSHFQLDISYEW